MSWRPIRTEDGAIAVGRRTLWLIALAVAAVVVVVVVIRLATGGHGTTSASTGPGSGASASPSGSPSATSSPSSPSSGASPTGTGSTATATPSSGSSVLPSQRKPQRVPFTATAQPARGVGLAITKVESVEGVARIRGEVSGPALRLTVTVTNHTSAPVSISAALTNLYYGPDKTPANAIMHPGSKAFPSSVPAHGSATGVVLYTVPKSDRSDVVLEVVLDNALRTVQFDGGCPQLC